MVRSCVVCRVRCHPTDLFRFQLNSESELVLVNVRTKGRSAWLCKKKVCIQKLEANPKLAQRALRQRPHKCSDLNAQIRFELETRIRNGLRKAFRNGQLRFHSCAQPVPLGISCLIAPAENETFPQQEKTIPRIKLPLTAFPKATLPQRENWCLTYKSTSKSDLLLRYLQEHGQMG